MRAVAVGDNFRFGHKQAGNIQVLRELGERFGFTTEVIPAVTVRGVLVSSSELRRLVEAGNVTRAARLLGRPYSLAGEVVPGHGVGQKQTVPTLNLRPTRRGASQDRRIRHLHGRSGRPPPAGNR